MTEIDFKIPSAYTKKKKKKKTELVNLLASLTFQQRVIRLEQC